MYKACIFDLDGTIADTVESIAMWEIEPWPIFICPLFR